MKALFLGLGLASASFLGGCFVNDSGSSSINDGADANLIISMGVKDVNSLSRPGLGKASEITLNKLIVTLTSSVSADTVIRDTVFADEDPSFVSTSTAAQQILRNYPVRPLRNWTIEVKTLDVNDSVIHLATSTQNNLGIGELRSVVLNLSSRFVVYAAKFTLPDSIGSQTSDMKEVLNVNRFLMIVNGDTARDTTSSPGWFAPGIAHIIEYDYVSVLDSVTVLELYVFGDSLGSWNPNLPIFGDTIYVTSKDTTYAPVLPWMGPGSIHDPNYDPANPGGAQAGLTINIGAVSVVNFDVTNPSTPLPKRKD